jgi:2-iminobutanoate/2-iminopropanoate deaminase
MTRKTITTPKAPAAVGPYSQAVRTGSLLFVSGQLPLDPETGTLVEGGIKEQTHQILRNIRAICEEAGASLGDVVKTTIYMTDLSQFKAVNETYSEYFPEHPDRKSVV